MSNDMSEADREKSRIRNRRHRAKNVDVLNAKSRAWYAANKEKAKATRKAWREKNVEKDKVDVKNYQLVNAEYIKIKANEWRSNNPEKVKASVIKYRERNHGKVLKQGSDWRKRNRDKVNANKLARIARKLQATPSWIDKGKVLELYGAAQAATEIFETSVHVDHIVPLRSKYVCGLHCEANLRLLPGLDNQRKSNRVWPDMPESLVA
jgi:hypothetical protein